MKTIIIITSRGLLYFFDAIYNAVTNKNNGLQRFKQI